MPRVPVSTTEQTYRAEYDYPNPLKTSVQETCGEDNSHNVVANDSFEDDFLNLPSVPKEDPTYLTSFFVDFIHQDMIPQNQQSQSFRSNSLI